MTPKWIDTNEYPFTSHYFNINGHRLHYIDEGLGETLLFIHGTPSWSFDFRHLISTLKTRYRCIAIDHMGFGLSDKPQHYDYSTQRHSKTLETFIQTMQLDQITLIVHDFGGPIGLNFAVKHPEKIKRIAVINSWMWSSKTDPDFIRFSKVLKSPLLPFLYKYLNLSARYLMPASFGDKKLSNKLRKQFTSPFGKPSERNGPLAFAHSLLNDQDWFETLWLSRESINTKPTLLIWGMKDKFVTPKYLDKFVTGFKNARVLKLDSCGHFPQEEAPDLIIESLVEFMHAHP